MKNLFFSLVALFLIAGCGTDPATPPTEKENKLNDQVSAMTVRMTRPDGLTDEEWRAESETNAKKDLAKNEKTDPEILRILAKDGSKNVALVAIKNPKTPIDVLREFLNDNDVTTRNYLAANTALEKDMFDILSKDPEVDVRQAAAANPSNTEENLKLLAEDKSIDVQQFLARNKKLPESVMLWMVEKSDASALTILIQRETKDLTPAVVEKLKAYNNEDIKLLVSEYYPG